MRITGRYDWVRFWCPREGSFSLGDRGYLVDPTDEYGALFHPDVTSFEGLSGERCLVLLGEPGIGKSDAMEQAKEAAERKVAAAVDLVDLRSIGSEDRLIRALTGSPAMAAWVAGAGALELFVDSFDECLLRIDTLAALLPEVLDGLPVDRLRLRIACRTGDWPVSLEKELRDLWGEDQVGVYELTPLRRRDVAVAVTECGLDPGDFLGRIDTLEAQSLANRPLTLNFLLAVFRERRAFPSSRADLFEEGCGRLAAENKPARVESRGRARGALGTEQRLGIAKCIAAVTVFSNRYGVWTGPPAQIADEDVILDQLRPPGTKTVHSDAELSEVLSTGLFSARGAYRQGWSHQSYAEYLAARWVVDNDLGLEQVLALITNPTDPDRRLVPQLHETAGWIATLRRDVFETLVKRDPDALLRGDVSTASVQQVRLLVNALLDGFELGRLDDSDPGLFRLYAKLNHPGLEDQLRSYVRPGVAANAARREAIRIAERCEVVGLQQDLLNVVLEPNEDLGIREAAARAAARLTDMDHATGMLPLLELSPSEDPNDHLRAHALERLWPDFLSADQLFENLRDPNRTSYFGPYQRFLSEGLQEGLQTEHLTAALAWVATQDPRAYRELGEFDRLADEIVIRSAAAFLDDGQLRVLAEIILGRARVHHGPVARERQDAFLATLKETETQRTRLIVACLEGMLEGDDIFSLMHPGRPMLCRDDFLWLLNLTQDPTRRPQLRKRAAEAVLRLLDSADPDQVSALLEAAQQPGPSQDVFAPYAEPIDLTSEHAEGLRAHHRLRVDLDRDHQELASRALQPLEPPPHERVQLWVARSEDGDRGAFWALTVELLVTEDDTSSVSEFEHDLQLTPGWLSATEAVRTRIVEAAKRHLIECDPGSRNWLGTPTWPRPALAGYKALILLLDLDSAFVRDLPLEAWRWWAPVIVAYPYLQAAVDDDRMATLACAAYKRAPDELTWALRVTIQRDMGPHDHVGGLERFRPCWDDRLSELMLELARNAAGKPRAFGQLLSVASEHGHIGTFEYARELVVSPSPRDCAGHRAAAVIVLLRDHLQETWDEVWSAVEASEDLSAALFPRLGEGAGGDLLGRLSEEHLAALYRKLVQDYPHHDDPEDDGNARVLGPRDHVAFLRENTLQALMGRGTYEAVKEIEKIKKDFPTLTWLRYVLLKAQVASRAGTWTPPSPAEVLALSVGSGTLVRTGAELLDAVVASLGRLQKRLQGETPAAIDLWNEPTEGHGYRPRDENRLSDYVKRHLESDLRERGVVFSREVEIRRGEGPGQGERTDIHVDAVAPDHRDGELRRLQAIIEVKCQWHEKLDAAMGTQLVGRYLLDNACGSGLYLVGWFACPQWDSQDPRSRRPGYSIGEARHRLQDQAVRLSREGLDVRSFVLDAGLRSQPAKKHLPES